MHKLPIVGSLSANASSNPGSGHYFWWYQYLDQQERPHPHQPVTISRTNQSAGHLLGAIPVSREAHLTVLAFGMTTLGYKRVLEAARVLSANGVSHIQCYDGGIAELFVMSRLAFDLPQTVFLYNFHWALDWVQLVERRRPVPSALVSALRKVAQHKPSNLFFSAESQVLASKLSEKFQTLIGVFPIMTTLLAKDFHHWDNRPTDVLVVPQRLNEVTFALNLLVELENQGLKGKMALHEDLASVVGLDEIPTESTLLPLPQSAYQDLLASSKIVVLPYDKPYFQWGSSGKFNDAIAVGTFPMVPSVTALGNQSSIEASKHHYTLGDAKHCAAQIVSRVEAGWPAGLKAVRFVDLRNWLESFTPEEKETSGFNRLWFWLAFLIALQYQPPRRGSRFARARNFVSSITVRGVSQLLRPRPPSGLSHHQGASRYRRLKPW